LEVFCIVLTLIINIEFGELISRRLMGVLLFQALYACMDKLKTSNFMVLAPLK
jgi:hypothetical protein